MTKITKQPTFGKESETLEFKESLSGWKEIIETISAFSNTKGGTILIGINDSGKIKGVDIGKSTLEDLANKIKENTDPKIYPHINTKAIDGKSIIIIDVKESSDHLILAFGRPLERMSKSTMRMSKDEYENLILEKHKDKLQFDTQICPKATIRDIDKEKVRWFLRKAKEERNYDIDPGTPIKEVLNRFNLMQNEKLTNTAILLFSKDSQRFFPQVKIRAGRLKGSEGLDFIDMKLLEGTIPELREKAITRQIYCQINNIGDTYAKKELKELILKKVVRKTGKGRSTCYVLVSD